MSTANTPNPLGAVMRTSAQDISAGVNSAVDRIVIQRQQSGPISATLASAAAARELSAIIERASEIVERLVAHEERASNQAAAGREKEAAEHQKSAKVLGVIAAVVIVVVACVLAAFTFGAGAALVALAVIAASAIIGAALAAARGAATFVNSPLAAQLAVLLENVQTGLRGFQADVDRDPDGARTRAFQALLAALRGLEQLAPQTDRLTGPCLGDPPATYAALEQLSGSLLRLAGALRALFATAEGGAVATALESLRQAVMRALQNLRPMTTK
jgi:uncharacterized membrane protein YgcG